MRRPSFFCSPTGLFVPQKNEEERIAFSLGFGRYYSTDVLFLQAGRRRARGNGIGEGGASYRRSLRICCRMEGAFGEGGVYRRSLRVGMPDGGWREAKGNGIGEGGASYRRSLRSLRAGWGMEGGEGEWYWGGRCVLPTQPTDHGSQAGWGMEGGEGEWYWGGWCVYRRSLRITDLRPIGGWREAKGIGIGEGGACYRRSLRVCCRMGDGGRRRGLVLGRAVRLTDAPYGTMDLKPDGGWREARVNGIGENGASTDAPYGSTTDLRITGMRMQARS